MTQQRETERSSLLFYLLLIKENKPLCWFRQIVKDSKVLHENSLGKIQGPKSPAISTKWPQTSLFSWLKLRIQLTSDQLVWDSPQSAQNTQRPRDDTQFESTEESLYCSVKLKGLNKTACWLLHITNKIYSIIHLLLFQIMGWRWRLFQQSPGDGQGYRHFSVGRYINILRHIHAAQSNWFWLFSWRIPDESS